jgi:hypothetical protein
MSALRARLMLKVMGLIVLLVLTIAGAHACSGSSPNSPADPAALLRNGLAGVCAEQQATSEAAGEQNPGDGQSPATFASSAEVSQLQASNPGGVQALERMTGGNLDCPTTTVEGNDG